MKEVLFGFLAILSISLIAFLTGRLFYKKAESIGEYVFKGLMLWTFTLIAVGFFHAIGALLLHTA